MSNIEIVRPHHALLPFPEYGLNSDLGPYEKIK